MNYRRPSYNAFDSLFHLLMSGFGPYVSSGIERDAVLLI